GRAHRAEAARRVAAAAGGLGLEQLTDRVPPTLSHAERVRLAVGRAVASEPKLVLLDEPAAGLDTDQRAALAGRIRQLAQRGLAVVLVDHDMGFVFELCDQVWALDLGRVIAHGSPSAVRADADVVAAYLGPDRSAPGRAAPGRAAPTSEPGEPRAAEPRVAAPDPALREQGPPGGSSLALQVQHLSAGYGGVPVVRDVSLCVGAGEVVALLGPNGAGKTTTLRAFSGLLPVLGGSVAVLGAPARGRADRLARRGLAHVPQDRALSPGLSVRDHLRMATRGRRSAAEEVLQEFPALVALLDRPAGRLSGGEQHMLALARALVAPHRLLVVDEVSLGLAPRLVERLLATLRRVASEEQAGVLVVEQHVGLALAVADRAYVMHGGRVVLEGPAPALAGDPALLASSYLGAGRPGPEPA
ncbi:MAG: ATP-binding cassette domain-containing protein, partial [Actinomycetota bacterium]|nr:ATP-binding cassette domain-containing protein [Actinomycetota bacterium]